jgi:hypothetical protein
MSSVLEQELVDKPCEPAPALRLLRQGAFTRTRQRVELGFAVRFRPAPGALDPALLLHADERRIRRALVERQRMVRHLRETGRERVGMKRPHRGQGAQDDEIERPLQQLDVLVSTGHTSGECQPLTRKSSGELRALDRPAAHASAVVATSTWMTSPGSKISSRCWAREKASIHISNPTATPTLAETTIRVVRVNREPDVNAIQRSYFLRRPGPLSQPNARLEAARRGATLNRIWCRMTSARSLRTSPRGRDTNSIVATARWHGTLRKSRLARDPFSQVPLPSVLLNLPYEHRSKSARTSRRAVALPRGEGKKAAFRIRRWTDAWFPP